MEYWTPESLRATVARLAAPRSEQEAYLRVLGTFRSADELALEFADELVRVVLADSGYRRPRPPLGAVDDALSAFSGAASERFWQCDALDEPQWEHVRALARAAVRELDAD
ncbi:MAG: hypothetical protein ACRDLP_12825 [Solirubrobacteraceae bacterium]